MSINYNSSAQQEILEGGFLDSGFSSVLQMPTGSGKTWLASQAIAEVLKSGKRAIYLSPLRALATELYGRWRSQFGHSKVGIFTGDYSQSHCPVSYENAKLLIMTTEKLDAITRFWKLHWNWIPEVDLIVADELHLLGDPYRGASLEGAMLRMMKLNPFLRFLGLSATLGNREELADWLGGISYYSDQRLIPLEWKMATFKDAKHKPEAASNEIRRNLAAGGQSLVFVQSRRRAEDLASEWGTLGRCAFHHAGMYTEHRQQIEAAFRRREIDILVATPTLEMGLNLPARQVVIYDLQTFNGSEFVPMSVNSVWQKAGRAGRPGLDSKGEVVLIAPSWKRGEASDYPDGDFEPIKSALSHKIALSSQVVAEVASGLARTVPQLVRAFSLSLAALQKTLPDVEDLTQQMLDAGMLDWVNSEQKKIRVTKLGFVAVRQMLSPQTVLGFKKAFQAWEHLTFFDLIVIAIASDDCELRLRVDFEHLEGLAQELSQEPSLLMGLTYEQINAVLSIKPRLLLNSLFTAVVVRRWTRLGNAERVANECRCYPFEVVRISETLPRLIESMKGVWGALDLPNFLEIAHSEKLSALEVMVAQGINEEAATLTLIAGVGANLAQRLCQFGISDIEALSLADVQDLVAIPGVGSKRASTWMQAATKLVEDGTSGYRYREDGFGNAVQPIKTFPPEVDPYRLRRALSLTVKKLFDGSYSVTGGLDPHIVSADGHCDCSDYLKGHRCKHFLAVRLEEGDPTITEIASAISVSPTHLDVRNLWLLS